MDESKPLRQPLKVTTTDEQEQSIDTSEQSHCAHKSPSSEHGRGDGADAARSKRNSNFFDAAFSYRDLEGSASEDIKKDSAVIVTLRTNVIVQDEYSFITSFAAHIAQRYQRDQSAILITLQHSCCVLFAGTFDPAYELTIAAIPQSAQSTFNKRNTGLVQSIQSTINKRNAVLVQAFLASHLGVPVKRGIVHFQPICEENLATNGSTVLNDAERRGSSGSQPKNKRNSLIQRTTSTRNVQCGESIRNRQSKRWTFFKEDWSPVSPLESSLPDLPAAESKADASEATAAQPNADRAPAEVPPPPPKDRSEAKEPSKAKETSRSKDTSKPTQESSGWRAKRKSIMHLLGR